MHSCERLTQKCRENCATHHAAPAARAITGRTVLQCAALALAAVVCSLALGGRDVHAAARRSATSTRAAQMDSLRSIPFDKLSEDVQVKLWDVVSKPSIFRRMPVQVVDCDPDLYVFLVRYPEVVVNMWQLMGITKATVHRTGARQFDACDGAGTVTKVELVYGTSDTHVMYAEGTYEGPLLKQRVEGKCVLVLASGFSKQENERARVTHQLDIFFQVGHPGAELLAKTLHPLIGRAADHNFAESSAFLGLISQAAERNGPGMEQFAARLNNVSPEIRERFANLAASVNHRAVLRAARPAHNKSRTGQSIAAVFRIESNEAGGRADSPEIYYLSRAFRRRGLQLRR